MLGRRPRQLDHKVGFKNGKDEVNEEKGKQKILTFRMIDPLVNQQNDDRQKHFGKNGDDDEVVEKVFIGACGGALTDKIKPNTEGYKKSQTPPSNADVADEGRKKGL